MPLAPGRPPPNLAVSDWVQGVPTNLDRERGKVVLVEVFQVTCPGCFMTAIPEAIRVYSHFAGQRRQNMVAEGLTTGFRLPATSVYHPPRTT